MLPKDPRISVTEGPQDIEFLSRILRKFHGLTLVTQFSLLNSFWKPLVPRNFPVDDDLKKRVPVPTFLQNSELSVALHSAEGIERLVNTIEESLTLISFDQIFGIGIVLDADDNEKPDDRFNKLISSPNLPKLSLPSKPGEVTKDSPRLGIFIMPNNVEPGTLEDILLECAKVNYPELLNLSNSYISGIDTNKLNKNDLKYFKKPAGKNKAIVSMISSVLRPGKTLQVSLQDNRWIDKETIGLNSVSAIRIFLNQVTGFI